MENIFFLHINGFNVLKPDTLLEKIFNSKKVHDENGNEFELGGNIDRTEGNYIYELIANNKNITNTLEVGCGYGISSLFISYALWNRDKAKHIIIDPLQYTEYKGIGISNLKQSDCNFFEFFEEPSEFVLPKLAETFSGTFDLIFIDGWHTFDHTLLDLFYSNRLLKIGGFLVIDDCRLPSVAKAVSYFSNYPSYRIYSQTDNSNLSVKARLSRIISSFILRIPVDRIMPMVFAQILNRAKYPSMITLIKLEEDTRNYNWYRNF